MHSFVSSFGRWVIHLFVRSFVRFSLQLFIYLSPPLPHASFCSFICSFTAHNVLLTCQGEDQLTTYTYNTHTAKHKFCKICGVQSFYQPRSNPSGYGTYVCLVCTRADVRTVHILPRGSRYDVIVSILPTSMMTHCLYPVDRCNATLSWSWHRHQDDSGVVWRH